MAKNLTVESLSFLLAKFSENERQAADAYTKLRDSLVRFFALKGDFEPDAAADETLDRVALKVAAKTPIEDLTKYSFGVARLVFLERLRSSQKEKKAAADFYAGRKPPLSAETDDFRFFRECFKALPDAERDFLRKYFADLPFQKLVELRRLLNGEMGFSAGQAQVKIFRLRKRLEQCVRKKAKKS